MTDCDLVDQLIRAVQAGAPLDEARAALLARMAELRQPLAPAGNVTKLDLPFPPSDNNYFKPFIVKGRPAIFTTDEGKRYQKEVRKIITKAGVEMSHGRLRVAINAWAPNRKKDGSLNRNRRDIQNILKCLLDAMQKAEAYKNDSQIDELEICRQVPFGEGSVEVKIRELPGDPSLFDAKEDDDAPAGPDHSKACPGMGTHGKGEKCCDRAGEYNGFGSGPTIFTCPKSCPCHD